ncbi:D-glycero-beta-D-manno-heptose 1,7-bisphosphate 7-phosphatase [Rhodospirillum sp. A1_3_36]|uniref:D-glycero-beta-D-manno-heptose 1,7-bisphosphate 7-phosphatase n=1 Tax=Rhodospirillum sp. A1_3_36 TaxID=3391666 RepID=UPI0039A76193
MTEVLRRAVLLDRDGTINVDTHYLSRPEQLELLPGAAEGLRMMRDLGFALIVVTNQSGIARGYFSEDDLKDIHARFRAILADEGITLDGIYYCPHGTEDGCICRKPGRGMVDQALADIDFDPARSFMIGDKRVDLDLGRAVGAEPILVRTGSGSGVESEGDHGAVFVADGLTQAAAFIGGRLDKQGER